MRLRQNIAKVIQVNENLYNENIVTCMCDHRRDMDWAT